MTDHTLGDAPIEPRFREMMRRLGRTIDKMLNGDLKGSDREVGFVLLVFPFGDHEGRCNYISSADRHDVVVMLKEQIARFECQPETKGHA
jgi:hypothetical protein